MTERLDLPRRYRDQIEALLREHVPGVEVWAYGSRVTGKSHKGSDLDLVLRGPDLKRIPGGQLMDLIEALEESNVPIIVQAHDWARLPERFHREIEREYVVLVEKKEWEIVTLRDLGTIITGKTPSTRRKTNFGGQIPFVTPRDLDDVRMIYKTERCLTDAGAYTVKNAVIPANTVMVSCIGSDMGKAAIAGKRCVTNQQINSIIINDKFDYRYIYYSLSTRKDELRDQAGGSAVPILNKGHFGDIEIYLPPLPEQRIIAHILGTLDDKIELNRRMNETLEGMARVLFKSWFVDFDPVRAKMEGRDTGLPPDVDALFPDRLVESELGEIPEGWEVSMIGDVASVSSGKRPNVRYPVASVEAAVPVWGGNGPMAFTTEPLIDYPILITGRVGTLGSVFRLMSPCWPSDNTLIIRASSNQYFEYLFFQMERIDFNSLNRGSTQPLLTQSDLKVQPIILSPVGIIEHFNNFTMPLFDKYDRGKYESRTLAALRDTLLPKLVSGEVRVNMRD